MGLRSTQGNETLWVFDRAVMAKDSKHRLSLRPHFESCQAKVLIER